MQSSVHDADHHEHGDRHGRVGVNDAAYAYVSSQYIQYAADAILNSTIHHCAPARDGMADGD